MKVSGRNKENCLFHLPRSRSPLWWLSKHHQGPLCFWQGRHELVDLSYGLLIYKSFLNPLVIILKDCAWCPLEKKWKMLSTELLMKAALFPSPQLGNALPPADPRTRLLGQEDCWCTEQGTCQSSLWGWETIRVSSVGALRIMKWDVVRPWVCVCTLALHGCLQDSRLRGNHVFKVFPLPAHLFLTPCQEGMSWSESHCFSL